MGIPSFVEGMTFPKLNEIRIESDLWQPIDHVEHIFTGNGAFYTNAAMPGRDGFFFSCMAITEFFDRQGFSVLPRGNKTATDQKQKAIDTN